MTSLLSPGGAAFLISEGSFFEKAFGISKRINPNTLYSVSIGREKAYLLTLNTDIAG